MYKFLTVLSLVATGFQLSAQENSPYSRYGLGDLNPNQNINSRGMGGITAGFFDAQGMQSINFTNPASISNISFSILDIGAEADIHTLKSLNPAKKYTQSNSLFSYLQAAFPIASQKMLKKGTTWGFSFGIKPVSRIDYKIDKHNRLNNIDSLYTQYEGTGGVNQAFFGTGMAFDMNKNKASKKINRLSLGLQFGYMFGNKDFATRLTFINDTVSYFKSNSKTVSSFGGAFVNAGMQYETSLKKGVLRIGMYGNLKQKLNAKQDIIRETFDYDPNGGTYRLDSVYDNKDVKGKVEYPSSFAVGFSYTDQKHWLYGADFETTNWANYRYYGQADPLINKWTIRAGAQYFPANDNTPAKKYFNFVKYRVGFYYGPDYVKLTSDNRPQYAVTLGTGMPLTSLRRSSFTSEYVTLNTALEIGGRGNKNSNVKDGLVRFSVGISMNARWFRKIKYD
jgi:hypothetical protein